MIAFIDDHRGAHGVEPICKVLRIAPFAYHAQAARRADPAKASARARRDAALRLEIRRVFDANFGVYGVRKVWRRLRREGAPVARPTMARLMRRMGLRGVVRGKETGTTVPDKGAPCPADLVNRRFRARRPMSLGMLERVREQRRGRRVSSLRRGDVEVIAATPRERMPYAAMAHDGNAGLQFESRPDRGLRLGRAEMVLFGDVQQEGSSDSDALSKAPWIATP